MAETMAEPQSAADSPDEFSIFINTWLGKTFVVPVSLDDSVGEVKAKLSAQDSSLTHESGMLLYHGRQMDDNLTLRHYEITPKSLLYYRRILRAGGEPVKHESLATDLPLRKLVADPHKSLTDEASGSGEESYLQLDLDPPQQGKCWRCVGEVLPEVTPEITQDFKCRTVYRAHLPGAGIFQCSITGLSFKVKSAVTITYRYATWAKYLSEANQQTWSPAGPLFHIEVQPGVVQSVRLPHFICLPVLLELLQCGSLPQGPVLQGPPQGPVLEGPRATVPAYQWSDSHLWGHPLGLVWTHPWRHSHIWKHRIAWVPPLAAEDVNTRLFSIAHFKSGTMILERPTRLIAFSAVLENPSFSLLGVLWRRLRSTLNSFPMHSSVLIFQQLSAADTTLHLYLIPDDNSVKQARLPFCYKSPREEQLFVEIYIRNMAEEIRFSMIDTRNDTVVWRASLRSGDINPPACVSKTLSGAAFLKKHKTKLCVRMRQLPSILLHLRDANIINSDEEEEVQSQVTSQRRNKVLLELAEKKGLDAQEQLYQILQMKDPYLIADLDKSS
ncbi:NACHT, LRR and PYD domains-containing protein 1-like isoform X2 [Aquila chrysaetos chrysaetos]|uniref:NACHT, LRR and PYD domains-containing protein 1-like isoform X2 n=1 Tax=Aquila chrysaetos chrysaetos TaxID=223781 RepID=UPI0011771DF8|nr:NACHT, LRR and PYD domains-containing protein 1-like isoform X2 [Aquila chrysaetos chrysaetos]